jgi:hypothetical protein
MAPASWGGIVAALNQERVELSISDYSQLGPLGNYLRLALPDIGTPRG